MKTNQILSAAGLVILLSGFLVGPNFTVRAQSEPGYIRPTPANPVFASIPGANEIISNILATPAPAQSMPAISGVPSRPSGTFWSLQRSNMPPLPFNPFPELPFYQLDPTNQIYVYDDRGVDYPAIEQERQAEALTNGVVAPFGGPVIAPLDLSSYTGLWLEIPTGGLNASNLTVIVHNTADGQAYTALTKEALTDSSWAEEQLFYGTNDDSTTIQLLTNGRTNLFVWARSGVPSSALAILSEPLDQDVLEGDTVTFSVVASGEGALTYQWAGSGADIPGATASSYTINNVQDSDAAGYAVTVSNGVTAVTSRTAQLTVEPGTGDPLLMVLQGPRQDYSFKSGVTYYVGSPVELYGTTTLRGGSVIKLDWNTTNSSLVVKGSLVCDTQPYFPAILTSVDDDSQGEWLYWVSSGYPQPAANGVAYLNLDAASSNVISNLRICFADRGVTTPVAFRELDVWDCQFYQCNVAIDNQVWGFGPRDILHNVLFAQCGSVVGASTNSVEIEAEHVTADVTNFWTAPSPPYKIALTNSIILGTLGSSSIVITQNTVVNPAGTVFQSASLGNYYLSANSPFHRAGSPSISQRLMAEFQQKSTYPPILLPPYLQISGDITLFPQAPRFTNGPPDLGFWYDALDYSVATLTAAGGAITVEPGVAIAVRNEYVPAYDSFTSVGFWIGQGSSFISHGTPVRPNVFTATKLVQETPATDFSQYQLYWGLPFGIVSLVSDWEDDGSGSPAPTFDFRFSNFYLPPQDYHYWSGLSEDGNWITSPDSSVYWSMQDCSVRGGRINLGEPDYYDFPADFLFAPGAVSWINNLFNRVNINLDPTLYEYGVDDLGPNCDLALQAYNNLFRGGEWFVLQPIPASAGNWVFEDNLFDKVDFIQNTASPLDFDYNGYWPKPASELLWPGYDASQLLPTTTGDGFTDAAHEQVLSAAPPYQTGPFGDFYLPTNTALYGAGSRTPANAGLYHYTTRLDQVKEGKEPAGHNVNIGVHYIAANNYGLPMDYDGDRIPDYVEDANGNGVWDPGLETDWQNPMTDGVTPDAYSTVYDNIDLEGDGLTGAQERAFGTNPLISDNPLNFSTLPASGQVSGIVTMPLNIGPALDTNTVILLTINGVAANSTVFETNGNWFATWDTTQITNGFYELAFELVTDEDGDSVPVATSFATVQNAICFPNDYPVAGTAIFAQPQTIYTNGTWEISVYDDQGVLFTNLAGNVDANGFFDDPATGQPGVGVSLLDDQGSQWPANYYTMVVTAYGQGGGSARATNTVPVEWPWTGNGSWAIAYMPIFIEGSQSDAYLIEMMGLAVNSVVSVYGFNSVVDAPLTADGWSAYRIENYSSFWTQLELDLSNLSVRNFMYFGHYDGTHIGGTKNINLSISKTTLQFLLRNAPIPLNGTNRQPYRFVFMDGCLTAKDNLCTYFGIPQTTISSANMLKKGLPPRAFVGWKSLKLIGVGNNLNQIHKQYIEQFFTLWPQTNPATGQPYALQDALHDAAYTSTGVHYTPMDTQIVIYGCPNLTFR